MRYGILLPPFILFAFAAAYSTHQRRTPTPEELAREEIRARGHAIIARNCEPEIGKHLTMRMRRRSEMLEREAGAVGSSTHVARATTPYYQNIQSTTCLTAPEVTEDDEYINNELIRQDVRESQQGTPLLMDVGVIDISTCTPMNYAFVEIWQANATGHYSGYNTATFNGAETWLRGGWYTDANGMVELETIYPGYYYPRAPHIHLMVHKDWIESDNGTLISHSGTTVHIGQAFFPEDWNDKVYNTLPYTSNINQRTANILDTVLFQASRDGYSPIMTIQYLNGSDLSGGLVGYLTVGVNSGYTREIISNDYSGTSGRNIDEDGDTDEYSNASASTQAPGWGNSFYLSLLMFAFFAYTCTPNHLRG